MSPFRALVFRPGFKVEILEVDGFKGLQLVIGNGTPATIERVKLDGTYKEGVALWLDEDGIAKGLEPCVLAIGPTYQGAMIRGTAIVCRYRRVNVGTENEDEVDESLRPEELSRWANLPRPALPERVVEVERARLSHDDGTLHACLSDLGVRAAERVPDVVVVDGVRFRRVKVTHSAEGDVQTFEYAAARGLERLTLFND